MANDNGCIARGIQRNRKPEQIGRRGELQPMPRLNPKINYHTATDTKWCSQRELTVYSFQPCLTVPVISPTPARIMTPARSRWPIALLVPSIESWQPQVTTSTAQHHQFTVPLFTTYTVPKEMRHWQMATDAPSAETNEIGNRHNLVDAPSCN